MGTPKALPEIFKGDTNAYSAVHQWIKYHKGIPRECEKCGDTTAKWYDWSNISGEYLRDFSDWQRVCRSCHARYDRKRELVWFNEHCATGHKMVITNLYIRKALRESGKYTMMVECNICRKARKRTPIELAKARIRSAAWRAKKKLEVK